MTVICDQHNSCDIFECRHRFEHTHYHMCDVNCVQSNHLDAKCCATIKEVRKQKIKKLNESNLRST